MTIKPRIWWTGVQWACYDKQAWPTDKCIGFGATPRKAFDAWFEKALAIANRYAKLRAS